MDELDSNFKNSNAPAFPTDPMFDYPGPGLTKREYFAAMAMQSIIKIKGVGTYDLSRNYEGVCNEIAQASIRVADELLKALDHD